MDAAHLVALLVDYAEGREADDALDLYLLGDLALERAHEYALARLVVGALDVAADAYAEPAVQPLLAALIEPARCENLVPARDGDVGYDLAVGRVALHVRPGQELVLALDEGGYLVPAAGDEPIAPLYPRREGGGLYY